MAEPLFPSSTTGADRLLPVPDSALEGSGEKQKVKHVKAAAALRAEGVAAQLADCFIRSHFEREHGKNEDQG